VVVTLFHVLCRVESKANDGNLAAPVNIGVLGALSRIEDEKSVLAKVDATAADVCAELAASPMPIAETFIGRYHFNMAEATGYQLDVLRNGQPPPEIAVPSAIVSNGQFAIAKLQGAVAPGIFETLL
jgi:hypothetical protein